MAGAQANVRNIITIEGVDNASDAINKAKKALGLLGTEADKSGKATQALATKHGEGVKKIQETSGDLESALKGLKDFTPGIAGQLSGLGDAFGATESVMRLLPGTAGLVATGLIAAGAGAYLLAKSVNESAAKLKLLGGSDVGKLKKDLDLSADSAVSLSQALRDLQDRALRPSNDLLKQVGANAKAMGKDGEKAQIDFVKAIEGGPEALKRFQDEYGKVNGLVADTTALAQRIGLNTELLGITKATTAEQTRQAEVTQALRRIQEGQAEIDVAREKAEQGRAAALQANQIADRVNGQIQAKVYDDIVARVTKRVEGEKDNLSAIQATAQAERDRSDVSAARLSRASVLESQAEATANKHTQATLRSEAVNSRILAAKEALAAFDTAHGKSLTAALATERSTLEVNLNQANAKKLADDQARKAAAQQAAQESSARRQAVFDADSRTQKARADRDGNLTLEERLGLLDREYEKDLRAAESSKGAKVKYALRTAADEEYVTKRKALERTIEADAKSASDAFFAKEGQKFKKSEDLARQAADAIVATNKARYASISESLRANGRFEEADQAERLQAAADYAAELKRIDKEVHDAKFYDLVQGKDLEAIKTTAEQKRIQAAMARDAVETKLAQAAKDRAIQARADAVDSLEGPANALKALGQLGPQFARVGGIGGGLSAAIKGFKDLDAAMSKSEVKATEVASAIGGAAQGIGASMIDAEKTRTLAQLDNEEKRRLSTATTEAEKAAITEEFEKKKADAVDAAERRKAAVMAAVELAQAIASAASYNFVAAAGHGAAAIAFGAVAGGVAGSSYVPGTGAAGQGGGFNAPSSGGNGGSSGSSGKGQTVVFNFNQPLATKQEIGKAVHGSLRSLSGTGTDRARGV